MRIYPWLAAALSLTSAMCASISLTNIPSSQASDLRSLHKASYLHVEGSRLVAANGHVVTLHGINLGGWLVTESWMCGFTDTKDTKETSGAAGLAGRSTLESLEDRFGVERAAALMTVWQDHWVTAEDLNQIRNDGFNLVRVPISYRTLQHADGSWILDARGQVDFSRMDWIVREAAQRGIYTIFDLHVWPQQRLDQNKIGRADGNQIRESMARLWTAVATHYRGNGAIAAFDLINEFPGNWGVQQVLAHSVRAGDPNRVLVVEGFTFPEFMKLYAAGEFPNSIFSEHLYGNTPLATEEFKSRLREVMDSPVPVYIGEFLAEDFDAATQAMTVAGMSWSPWTYKAVDMGNWAVFNYYSELRTDIQNEDYQNIQAKWSADLIQWQTPGAPQNHFTNDNRRNSDVAEPSSVLEE